MKTRLSTENEIKLITTEIVNNLKLDAIGLFDYSDDDMLDDFVSIKNNMHALTIETNLGYKIVNAVTLEPDESNNTKNIGHYTFVIFNDNKAYMFEGDFVYNNMTEEKYLETANIQNQLRKLESDVNIIKHRLKDMSHTDKEYLPTKQKYNEAVKKLNDFINKNGKI